MTNQRIYNTLYTMINMSNLRVQDIPLPHRSFEVLRMRTKPNRRQVAVARQGVRPWLCEGVSCRGSFQEQEHSLRNVYSAIPR